MDSDFFPHMKKCGRDLSPCFVFYIVVCVWCTNRQFTCTHPARRSLCLRLVHSSVDICLFDAPLAARLLCHARLLCPHLNPSDVFFDPRQGSRASFSMWGVGAVSVGKRWKKPATCGLALILAAICSTLRTSGRQSERCAVCENICFTACQS